MNIKTIPPTDVFRFVKIIEMDNLPSKINKQVAVYVIRAEYKCSDGTLFIVSIEQIGIEPFVPSYMMAYELDLLQYQWYHKMEANKLPIPFSNQSFWLRYFRGDECLFDDIIFYNRADKEEQAYFFDYTKFLPYMGKVTISIKFDHWFIRHNEAKDNLLYGHILIPLEKVDECLRTGQRNKG